MVLRTFYERKKIVEWKVRNTSAVVPSSNEYNNAFGKV